MERKLDSVWFIGREDQLRGFHALGATVAGVESLEEAEAALRRALKEEAVAVFISEDFGERLQELIESLIDRPLPTITVIPTAEGTSGVTRRKMRRLVERAVGADIMGGED